MRLTLAVLASMLSVLLAVPAGESSPGIQATGQLLRNDTGLYPRAVRLASGVVVASVVTFGGNASGLGAIYQSTDGGAATSSSGRATTWDRRTSG